jgi:hypothetical protein
MADEMDSAQPAPQGQNPLVQEYYNTTEARKAEAKAQMDKLIRALDSRKNLPFDPMLMRVAGALLQPTKTGSAGESIGYAASAAADEAEKQVARNAELAKMEFELGEKMRQQQATDDQMKFRMKYFGNKPAAGAPAAAPDLAMPSLTATPPVPAQELSAVPQMSTPEAPAVLPQEMPQAAPPPAGALPPAAPPSAYVPRQIDPMLAVIDPVSYEIEMKRNEAARRDAELIAKQKEAAAKEREQELKENSINVHGLTVPMTKDERKQVNEAIAKKDLKTLQSIFLPKGSQSPFIIKDDEVVVMPAEDWKRKQKAAEELGEIKRTIRNKTYLMTGPEAIAHDEAKRMGGKLYNDWVNNYFKELQGGTAGPTAEPVISEEERTSEQKRRERLSEKRGEAEAKSRDEIISNAKTAAIIERPAAQIFKIASDPIKSKALGLLENPTVFDAIVGATAEGVRAGPINIGIPAIREAVAKISGNPKEREQILDALQMLGRNYSEIELNFTRLYLKGEGQVTEGERAIVRQVSGGVANRRTVALAQTETLMQRAAFDKAVKSEYLRWEKANPGKSIDEFSESAGYQKLFKNFEDNTDKIYDKYFSEKKEPKAAEPKAAPSAAPASGGSLRERIEAEKKARGLK